MECQGDYSLAVKECAYLACPLYAYREGKRPATGKYTPTKIIKYYCHEECQAGSGAEEVRTCAGDEPIPGATPCPLFPFRMGRNPRITESTREKLRQAGLKRAASGKLSFSKSPALGGSEP